MKKIKFYIGIGLVTCDREEIFEFPDDVTYGEIDEALKEWVWNYLDVGYEELED